MILKTKMILAAAIGLTLIACNGEVTMMKEAGINGDRSLYTYYVKGIPLECVRRNSAMSCNWGKYNQIIEACKARRLAERTAYDKDGNEIIFPPVEGDCGE